jgi:hypothetical protein
MSNTRKTIICGVISYLLSFAVLSQTIKVGVVDYPPHVNFNEALNKSPLIKYMNNISLPSNHSFTYIKLPRLRASVELEEGRVDILMPIPVVKNTMMTISSPLFHATPGLCFKKENFIPILSATHRFESLMIGFPANSSIVSALENSGALLIPLMGENAVNRGIELTQRGRFDAFYHPSPVQVYHRNTPGYKEVACSYFHGYSTPVYIAVANVKIFNLLNSAYQKALSKQSYEYYFANRDN